ncbi:hypothetical protein MMUR_38580 [Mycolicibacterium murale]|jgi:hypothetical protein|uniref:Protein of uncharacterized function (DUF1707) n=2 Tax=Mycolicibacterium TaxID=1866885 RepID=A0A378T9K4_9MYCO|nr:hypothetical protein MMUR_38580 [Mycolicibacterium murale]STZ56533.1 protein of uncharacterised function (DUF1707) [Mycolicibacterium tokaiense]
MGRVLRIGLVPMLVRVDARDYRVGDAEREQVVGLLQQAVGQGMLTLDEFTDRMDAALAARTRGELGEVVADLPVHSAPAQVEVLPLNVTMSSIRRSGRWLVPGRVAIKSRFSSVVLDLTQADIRTPVVTFDLDDICGSTDIIVPDDFTADLDHLRCLGASANSRVNAGPPVGRVHLIVRGNVRFGALTVKHPFGAWIRKNLR